MPTNFSGIKATERKIAEEKGGDMKMKAKKKAAPAPKKPMPKKKK